MEYDIAGKVAIEASKEVIIRKYLNIEPESIEFLEELPQETVSLRRGDFPLYVRLRDGGEVIVLIEIQTSYDRKFVLRLIDYTVRFMLKYELEVFPLVILLRRTGQATGFYETGSLRFSYNIVRLWEESSEEYLKEVSLYPFIALTRGGELVLEEAENRLYSDTSISIEKKADLLTAMAIFAGLKDEELARKLIERRRDIMIQSAAYRIIKEEGLREGMREGIREMVLEALNERFGEIPSDISKTVNLIEDRNILRQLLRFVIRCGSLDEFRDKVKDLGLMCQQGDMKL